MSRFIPNPKKVDEECLKFLYQQQNKKITEISKILGVHYRTITRKLRELGIYKEKIQTVISYEKLYELYILQDLSIKNIAKQYSSCTKTVNRRLKEFDLISIKQNIKNETIINPEYWSWIIKSAKERSLEFNITKEYALNLFFQQNEICKLSGIEIKMCSRYLGRTASLDRIDNSKGYIEGNVQWVHKEINRMKGTLSDEEFIEFCTKVAGYNIQNHTLEYYI